MQSIKRMMTHKISMIISQGVMTRMNRAIINMKAEDMSVGTTIIVVGDLQVEADSLELKTTSHDDQFSVSHVTTKVIDVQTICTKTIMI